MSTVEEKMRHLFDQLTGGLGYQPYPYQERVAERLLAGRNVILTAPTGAGKSWAALLPFLYGRKTARKLFDRLIFAMPLRTLATTLHADTIESCSRAFFVRSHRDNRPGLARELAITIQTGERKRLDYDFVGGGTEWSPDRNWLMISAARLYEQSDAQYGLWLLSADGLQLLRVTSAPPQDVGGFWSPDGTRLVFRRDGVGLVTLSLETGSVNPLGVNLVGDASYNYAVGGAK